MKRPLICMLVLTAFLQSCGTVKTVHYERNVKVIRALANANSNMNKLHSIEHHIYSFTLEDFKGVSDAGTKLGYKVMHVGENEGDNGKYWYQDLVKDAIPTIKNVEFQSAEISKIANRFSSKYDGLGTNVEK